MPGPYDHDLTALFAHPALTSIDPSPDRAFLAWPYQALRHLQAELGDQRPLLSADHTRLRSLLELSAVTDPRLFHAMLLHHCMTVGNALDQGASDTDVAALASGHWIGTALMTEQGHGNSSANIRTEATYDLATREFVLNTPGPDAVKSPASVGLDGFARMGVVSARLKVGGADRGTVLFLVPLRDEEGPCAGVTIEPFPRTSALYMDYASVRFDQVRVPYRRWLSDGASIAEDGTFRDPLGGPDARSRRSTSISRFAWGAVTAGLAAVARSSVVLALTRAGDRPTNDRLAGQIPAIAHLNQQRLLFTALTAALTATVIADRATRRSWHIPPGGGCGHGPSAAEMRALALDKVTVQTLADTAVTRCRSTFGAAGFFSENRLIDYQAFIMAFQSGGGDNTLVLLDAAWTMAAGLDYLPPDDHSAPDDWCRLFRARERLLHTELTTRLRAGEAPFTVWNDNTELAQRFARAHAARTTAEALHSEWHVPALPDADRLLLGDLYQLHCLEELTAGAAWYLAYEFLTAEDVLALPERINEVCRRLVQHTAALTRLLQIPGELLPRGVEPPVGAER